MLDNKKTILSIIIIIFISGYYIENIVNFVTDNLSDVVSVISIITGTVTTIYNYSERFYLFVNRNILNLFKKHDSRWKFIIKYTSINTKDIELLKSYIKESIYLGKYYIKKDLKNSFTIEVENELTYEFIFTHNQDLIDISIITNKITVTSRKYEDKLSDLILFFNDLEYKIHPQKRSYQFIMNFDGLNPYYGFFIKRVDPDKINDFTIKFISPLDNDIRISSSKHKITLDTSKSELLRKAALSYLNLKSTILNK